MKMNSMENGKIIRKMGRNERKRAKGNLKGI
jgi:hypothetical protein